MNKTTLRLPAQALQESIKEEKLPEELLEQEKKEEEVLPTAPKVATEIPPAVEAPLPEYPTYQAGRLNQVILPDGTILKPVDGIYTATTEAAFDMLNYYSEQDTGLVSKLF